MINWENIHCVLNSFDIIGRMYFISAVFCFPAPNLTLTLYLYLVKQNEGG